MTTLHLKDGELRDAVAQFPTVASVGASTSFPHTLHVTITERLPVAFIKVGAEADRGLRGRLPAARGELRSQATAADRGAPARGAAARRRRGGAGGHPRRDPGSRFATSVTGSSWDDAQGGVVVSLDGGPDLRFGDGSRARDKWTAAVAVLSSSEHGSPSYLDVSVPDRPVSGG